MRLVIRADGGSDIGYGHLIRTGGVAAHWLAVGGDVVYATATPNIAERVVPAGAAVEPIASRTNPASLVDILRPEGDDIVLIDSYAADSEYQYAVRDVAPLGVVVDDSWNTVAANLLVNGNLYAEELTYDTVGAPPIRCLGPKYALLSRDVERLARNPPSLRDPPRRLLVTMGGSDVANSTPETVRAVDALDMGFDLQVTVVVGPGFTNVREVRAAVTDAESDITTVSDPPDLPRRLMEADLAISACGSTTYELLALGTPFVGLPQVDNQRPVAEALDKHDAAVILEQDATEEAIGDAVRNLAKDHERRRDLRRRGRELVDGEGSRRVYERLAELGAR